MDIDILKIAYDQLMEANQWEVATLLRLTFFLPGRNKWPRLKTAWWIPSFKNKRKSSGWELEVRLRSLLYSHSGSGVFAVWSIDYGWDFRTSQPLLLDEDDYIREFRKLTEHLLSTLKWPQPKAKRK